MGGAGRLSYSIAVRALCEFTAKVGDLDLRFTPSPTALEGIVGHRTVASRRSEGYQSEVALEGQYQTLKVKGRADGYDPGAKLPGRSQNLSRRPEQATGQPPSAALGAGEDLRLVDVPETGAGADQSGAGVFRHRQRKGNLPGRGLQRRANCSCSSNSIARCSCTGPSRKWPIAKGAIGRRNNWRFPMPTFVRGSAIWPNRCSRPSAPVAA